ncbi:MAG: DEAD/DEAH box helicase [Dehalococcoidia bacterium]
MTQLTIGQTIDEIKNALSDYIEATYHVGHPALVSQRKSLLAEEGTIFRAPYLESTPRYQLGRRYAQLAIPSAAKELFALMSESDPPLIYDPPYSHQAIALEESIGENRNLVITTGTGSGKTESFLLPIFARLAGEARDTPASFATPAVRAILLYPMNALVNDQLGRLRLLLGNASVSELFMAWAGRPARFARYTSRTLYPGVRTAKKDQDRLRPIERFYVSLLEQAADPASPQREAAAALIDNLRRRGKWPAKGDLPAWYGAKGSRWTNRNGDFVRAVMRPDDPELLTRDEMLTHPADVLITNYSMLEYMMMRPLERPIFDATKNWLSENPEQKLLLVVDEAHLYRGAAGAEVGLLLRRLRARLGIPEEQLQVICTSASFANPEYAREFGAQLTGTSSERFRTIQGELALRPGEAVGSQDDADALNTVDLAEFYAADDDAERIGAAAKLLAYLDTPPGDDAGSTFYAALTDFSPLSLLVNLTMREAIPVSELSDLVFPGIDATEAARALTVLIALGSMARRSTGEPGLLPCRIHAFFRGLPGLWACVDPNCSDLPEGYRGSPVGTLYAQPRDTCVCGARVFELYTCRNCGAAYARTYTDDLTAPQFLWGEPGRQFQSVSGQVAELLALDLLLEAPSPGLRVEPADLDLVTGRLNPPALGPRTRQVFLPLDRTPNGTDDRDEAEVVDDGGFGEFRPCGVCGGRAGYGRSSVQDHQTKGDQPFQALVTRQIQVQPPGPQPFSEFAPLRGRKVLAFSDSRQTAARLAPNLQTYSMQDVLRPVILHGWRRLEQSPVLGPLLTLEDLYLASVVGARLLGVRLRPELRGTESHQVMQDVARAVETGALDDPERLLELAMTVRGEVPPQSLLRGISTTITDRYYGFESLALASLRAPLSVERRLCALPPLRPSVVSEDQKLALGRAWIGQWTSAGIWFQGMNPSWWKTPRGVRPHSGRFRALDVYLDLQESKRAFEREWLPVLLESLCEGVGGRQFRLRASRVRLDLGSAWGYCQACRTTQRPFPGTDLCSACGKDRVVVLDPDVDRVFAARKGYYRASSVRALADPPETPMAIIAAEHTAQLNSSTAEEVFSKAEEHELLFQDVELRTLGPVPQAEAAIDVLSCTTTMEVGIDIGTLSGVALRNMPPSRASYQQRSGRAGRRGNAVATVVAFGSADSHDEHYFAEPDAMIRGQVADPVLTLDNAEIARRHVTAFLLQAYHHDRLPEIPPADQPQLFEVLGSVRSFLQADSTLNRGDFGHWLEANEATLTATVEAWLPRELGGDDRNHLLQRLVPETLVAIDNALIEATSTAEEASTARGGVTESGTDGEPATGADDELPAEPGEERRNPHRAAENLLDRLLYKGVLPRYAFPTDVVAFHVFDQDRSTRFRTEYQYAPSQGLPTALTQYAPGKEVWVDGKLWTSGALYSPMPGERFEAWERRRLYFECSVCHYASTEGHNTATRGETRTCPACGADGQFGGAKNWMRPPGFAHPVSQEEGTSPDDQPARSYATRAKLVAQGPADPSSWREVTPRLRLCFERTQLLVSNTGPRGEGYSYCTQCGLIQPTAIAAGAIVGPHLKPFPDERQPQCAGTATTRGLVLGTDFISDVLLISLRVESPLVLQPGYLATDVALRTLSEAFTLAATRLLEIEAGEVQAEYRPALTSGGQAGLEAEIYIYDTLAGGAGFARRIGELGIRVFEDALSLLETCPAMCDRACYRCLRSFKNRFEHDLLDRFLGASLLRYLLTGAEPRFDDLRVRLACDRLFADLSRQGIEGVALLRDSPIEVPGIGVVTAPILARSPQRDLVVGVHGPLTPDYASDTRIQDAKEYGTAVSVLLLDEIVISRNLQTATRQVMGALGK